MIWLIILKNVSAFYVGNTWHGGKSRRKQLQQERDNEGLGEGENGRAGDKESYSGYIPEVEYKISWWHHIITHFLKNIKC